MTLGDRLEKTMSRNTALSLVLVVVILLSAIAVTPKSYQLEVGSVYQESITAPREVEDAAATKDLKKRAREAVSPVYSKRRRRNRGHAGANSSLLQPSGSGAQQSLCAVGSGQRPVGKPANSPVQSQRWKAF